MSNDQTYPLHEIFVRVLDEVGAQLGSERVDSISSTLYAGEPEEAFQELISSLYQGNCEVSSSVRTDLKTLAEGLNLLDYEHGKGHYW